MSNVGSSYSQIIPPKDYNRIVSSEHLYISTSDTFLVDIIKELARNSAEVVELGCGPARVLPIVNNIEGLNLTGIDLDSEFLDYAKRTMSESNVQIIAADVENYIHSKEVDIFYSHGLHHHIAKGLKTLTYLRNVYNNLKNGGYYILIDEFIPHYNNAKEREINIVKWYSHIIAHAVRKGYSYLAQEEAKIFLDDLFEGRTSKNIKSQVQINFVLSKVRSIDEASRNMNLSLATLLAKEFLAALETFHNLKLHGDSTLDLSRGDYKICDTVFKQEVEEANLKIESVNSFGPIETIGAVSVYVLRKG